MIYRIYAQKDSTIYEPSQRKVQNTGGDQILEISKIFDEETNSVWLGNSRVLIKFDLSSISQSIANNEISNTNKFYINLTSAEEKEIKS